MRSLRLCLLSCLASLLASPGLAAASAPGGCPALLYGTDFDGTVFGGSKAALIEAVSRGDDIRVGWTLDVDEDGAGDLSHWAPATVLTIWEDEVFTQVPDIHRQRPVRGEADIRLPDGAQVWPNCLNMSPRNPIGGLTAPFSTIRPFCGAGSFRPRAALTPSGATGRRARWCGAAPSGRFCPGSRKTRPQGPLRPWPFPMASSGMRPALVSGSQSHNRSA